MRVSRTPEQLAALSDAVAADYQAGIPYSVLESRYHMGSKTIRRILDARGISGHHNGRSRRVRDIPEPERIPCPAGVTVNGAPKPCVMHDLGNCLTCLASYESRVSVAGALAGHELELMEVL